jgi:hypothetical protein
VAVIFRYLVTDFALAALRQKLSPIPAVAMVIAEVRGKKRAYEVIRTTRPKVMLRAAER